MKLNKLTLTLGVFLVLLAYFLITQAGDRGFNTVDLPKLAAPAGDDIQKIEVLRPAGRLVLERKDTAWLITEPLQFAADKNQLDHLRGQLSGLRITDLISSRPEAEADYGLNSATAMTLKVFTKNKTLALTVGQANRGATHTFVKVPKDQRVYQVLGDLSTPLATPAMDWRSLQINDFSPDNARSITVVRAGKTLLNAAKAEEPAAAAGNTGAAAAGRIVWKAEGASGNLDDAKVSQLLSAFCRLTGARIADTAPAEGKPLAVVTVKTVGPEETLEFLAYQAKEKRYLVRKAGTNAVYELDEYQANTFLKSQKDLI